MLYNIEVGDKNNLDQILKLNKRIFRALNKPELIDKEVYEETLNKKKSLILLVKEGKVVVGNTIAIVRGKNYHILITALTIDQIKHRVAEKLFDMNKQIAKDSGFDAITVTIYDEQKELIKVAELKGFKVYRKNQKEGFQDYKIDIN